MALGLVNSLTGVPATAMTAPIKVTQTVNIRPGPSVASGSPLGTIPAGTSPNFLCWAQGQVVNGVDVWFKITYAGKTGYYASYYDNSSYATDAQITTKYGIPKCGTTPPPPVTGTSRIGSKSASLDWCPGNASVCQDSRRLAVLAPNTPVTMKCWIDARHVAGYVNNRWFYVMSGTLQGFVKAELVTKQTAVGACSGNPAVSAALWATGLADYNQKQPTATDRARMATYFGKPNNGTFSGWGAKMDWSGDCISFAALAWLNTGTSRRIAFGNAIDSFKTYQGRKMVHTTGTPPRGALVYWHAYSGGVDYGHVAVSLGNGRVVTTQGWDNQLLVTTDKAIWAGSIGWVMPF